MPCVDSLLSQSLCRLTTVLIAYFLRINSIGYIVSLMYDKKFSPVAFFARRSFSVVPLLLSLNRATIICLILLIILAILLRGGEITCENISLYGVGLHTISTCFIKGASGNDE